MNTLSTMVNELTSRLELDKVIYDEAYKRIVDKVGKKDNEAVWLKSRTELIEDYLSYLESIKTKGDE